MQEHRKGDGATHIVGFPTNNLDMFVKMGIAQIVPGSKGGYTCCMCGEDVTMSPSGQKYLKDENLSVMCIVCSVVESHKGNVKEHLIPSREDIISDFMGASN